LSGTLQIRKMMLADLHHVINSSMRLMDKIKSDDWEYRPTPVMRSLKEVAQHLAAIPGADLLIMQEKGEDEVSAYERSVGETDTSAEMKDTMVKGYTELAMYMESLSVYAYLNEITKAFYADSGFTQARWLLEVITHTYHHRAQLFNYLKQLGYDVSMRDLY